MKKMTVNMTADMLETGALAYNEEDDYEFARLAMPSSLKMMEGMLKSSPENKTILYSLAQGYCSYAFVFLEDSDSASRRPQHGATEPRVPLQLLLRQLYNTCSRHHRKQP
jgi:hypothetical protein